MVSLIFLWNVLLNIYWKLERKVNFSKLTDPESNNSKELIDQNDKIMEYILDISNELDINVLCHKILVNVCHLTKADRSSLFLARGPRGKRYLEAKLFNVAVDTSKLFFVISCISLLISQGPKH